MRRCPILVTILTLVRLTACSSSGITNSWVAPDVGPIRFEKALVVVMHPVESVRRIGEDRLVRRIGRSRAVASHTLISQDDIRNTVRARAAVEGAGFDGAVIMRVVGLEETLSYQPTMIYPNQYGQFWGFFGYASPLAYGGGIRSDTTVRIETTLYSITNDEKLIWSGISEAFNPIDVGATVDDIVDDVSAELRRVGLIAE